MSLKGRLEDVGVADVLQFVHLGGRTGTLRLFGPTSRGEIAIYRGHIVGARGPTSKRLGDLLVSAGAIAASELEDALRIQRESRERPPLGKILVSMGLVSTDALRDAIEREVERTIYDLVTWTRGEFEFVLDEVTPIDDLLLSPGDVLPEISVNTQMVLLEAARLFDERSREEPPPEPPPSTPPDPPAATPSSSSRHASGTSRSAPPPTHATHPLLAVWVTDDVTTSELLDTNAVPYAVQVVSPDEIAELIAPRAEGLRVALVDLANAGRALSVIERLASALAMRVIAVASSDTNQGTVSSAYTAGALAVVPPDPAAIEACIANLCRTSIHRDPRPETGGTSAELARLRRMHEEFRSGLVTATVSLNLMNVISESAERAVLFLVRKNDLVVLGAFGQGVDGSSLAERTRGLRIVLDEGGILAETVREGRSRTVSYEQAHLPKALAALLGAPGSGQCSVFPVLGGRRVVASIYADNGPNPRALSDHEFLELAASQVGMAFENELLRRQLGEGPTQASWTDRSGSSDH